MRRSMSAAWSGSRPSPSTSPSTSPFPMGARVSDADPNAGTPSVPIRPNSTLPPFTRSVMPSALTLLKYRSVVLTVST
ncbi:hypothetical protein ACIBQ1_20485 [Nonomuraea sp. NPDC050153]|uniref:hypothetical protein n=1 Tax=Nonomuraea sp. NPDC050153 TaxID=3364359 RepID=UPI003789E051